MCWGEGYSEGVEYYGCCPSEIFVNICLLICFIPGIIVDCFWTKHVRRLFGINEGTRTTDALQLGFFPCVGWILSCCNCAYKSAGCFFWNNSDDCSCDFGFAPRYKCKCFWCGGACCVIDPEP